MGKPEHQPSTDSVLRRNFAAPDRCIDRDGGNARQRHAAVQRLARLANEFADKARQEAVGYHLETGLLPPEAREALATPLIRHGIKVNRKVLETTAQYSFEQGLTPRLVKIEEMFAPSVMEQ